MRKLTLMAAIVWLISSCGMNADGQTTVQSWGSHFVGAGGPTTGAAGTLVGMNDLCQSVYGPDAHMCTVDQFFFSASTTTVVATHNNTFWAQPSLHDCVYESSTKQVTCRETGVSGRQPESAMFQICDDWMSDKSSNTGTIVLFSLSFFGTSYSEPCNNNIAVACCAP